MKYEYAIYDILGWILGVIFNRLNLILVAPVFVLLIAAFALLGGLALWVSFLVQSLLVCGIVWAVSMVKEYQNLYRRFLTQKGAFLRYTTIVTTIITAVVVAANVLAFAVLIAVEPTVSQDPQEPSVFLVLLEPFWVFLSQIIVSYSFVGLLLPLVLILQMIFGAIVVLVSSEQRRQMFRVSIFGSIVSIVRYILITIVSFLLNMIIWSTIWSVVIFCGWMASLLIPEEQRGAVPVRREYYYSTLDELVFWGIILVTFFALFVLARVLIAILDYRLSNTEGAG